METNDKCLACERTDGVDTDIVSRTDESRDITEKVCGVCDFHWIEQN